ncbi:MAG: hypothetical protein AAFR90_12745 [Pseudomonadota bacterium]
MSPFQPVSDTRAAYRYNGLRQLTIRTLTNMGADNGTTHLIHDLWDNVIIETDGAGVISREYIWLPDAGYAGVALPLAVVTGVNMQTPAVYYVHTDHLSRPMIMTDTAKTVICMSYLDTVWPAPFHHWHLCRKSPISWPMVSTRSRPSSLQLASPL